MRLLLVGAVESTHTALVTLLASDVPPVAVMTLPESRASRHSDWIDLRPLADDAGIPVVDTPDINASAILEEAAALVPDYALVIGWSQICRSSFLGIPTGGAIGYHPAPLPENRGRAVIPWTILQGRRETGSTLFWMDTGMDTGDILVQERFPVAPDETARSLYDKHLEALGRSLITALPLLDAANPPRLVQDHDRATYCARRTRDDGLIDWASSAASVWTLVRATGDPYPGAFSFRGGRRLTVWEADHVGAGPYWGLPGQVQALVGSDALVQCGDGEHLLLRTVQLEGEQRAAAADVLRVHERLGVDWPRLVLGR